MNILIILACLVAAFGLVYGILEYFKNRSNKKSRVQVNWWEATHRDKGLEITSKGSQIVDLGFVKNDVKVIREELNKRRVKKDVITDFLADQKKEEKEEKKKPVGDISDPWAVPVPIIPYDAGVLDVQESTVQPEINFGGGQFGGGGASGSWSEESSSVSDAYTPSFSSDYSSSHSSSHSSSSSSSYDSGSHSSYSSDSSSHSSSSGCSSSSSGCSSSSSSSCSSSCGGGCSS